MEEIIDRNINSDEVLVRCIFVGDFKRNKSLIEENIVDKDVFVDTRPNVDVSLLRRRYYSKEECKKRGKQIKDDFVGFLIFKKEVFDNVIIKHRENSANAFEAEIMATPLDENQQVIPLDVEVNIKTPVNPGHADIKYINPGLLHDDENPNTAIRRFSRTLFKECKICINF
ncbi:MAG: hypothetical protein O9282_13465 [Flavobacterium sp.]|jgi:hypothetical protein|uniref:hypothetical protein n=1 Tax=Flavobacterium sp. TaxID=239 RepID=UPI0022CCC3E7|nr:hypothetical protein [Flavobacterium sp.]MCZ8091392.1 hypothetical protein [Flavobacterium sp.]MCZ8332314.1 hypothetical protein [Flavobacterium sp.]